MWLSRIYKQTKRTAWWNDEIKTQVKAKKKLWKEYLGKKTPNAYDKYKEQREEYGKRCKENNMAEIW